MADWRNRMDQITNKVKSQLFAKGVDNMNQLQDIFLVSKLFSIETAQPTSQSMKKWPLKGLLSKTLINQCLKIVPNRLLWFKLFVRHNWRLMACLWTEFWPQPGWYLTEARIWRVYVATGRFSRQTGAPRRFRQFWLEQRWKHRLRGIRQRPQGKIAIFNLNVLKPLQAS